MEQEVEPLVESVGGEDLAPPQEPADSEIESLTADRIADPLVSVESAWLDLQTLSEIASIVSAFASVLVVVALLIAVRQLIIMEKSRKLETYTSHLISYGDSNFLEKISLLEDGQYSNLSEFRSFFEEQGNFEVAWAARREIKTILSQYGYSVAYGIASVRDIAPLLPIDAVRVWPKLLPVEKDIVKEKGRWPLYEKGLDDVALVEALMAELEPLLR